MTFTKDMRKGGSCCFRCPLCYYFLKDRKGPVIFKCFWMLKGSYILSHLHSTVFTEVAAKQVKADQIFFGIWKGEKDHQVSLVK